MVLDTFWDCVDKLAPKGDVSQLMIHFVTEHETKPLQRETVRLPPCPLGASVFSPVVARELPDRAANKAPAKWRRLALPTAHRANLVGFKNLAFGRVAEVLRATAHRPLDVVARFGGEEFAMVLYGPDTGYGRDFSEKLREAVLQLRIPHQGSMTGPYLSVSIGVANVMPDADRSLEGAVQMADEALYKAKEEGRDRVIVRDSPNTTVETGRFRVAQQQAIA